MRKLLLLLPCLILLLAGCKTKETLGYFRTPSATEVVAAGDWQLRLEAGDRLNIGITAPGQGTTLFPDQFNLMVPNGAGGYLMPQYEIPADGFITMPTIGRVKAAGLTVPQLAEEITRLVAEHVEAPTVTVELVNFKVRVLGEVAKPGSIEATSERLTVLDAIAEAGDLTVFGKRDNVTLIREKDGKIEYHPLDLTQASIIESPYYYLKQNDVIYVEPNQAREGQAEYSVNNTYKIQVVSAIVSGASVIASLIIALVTK